MIIEAVRVQNFRCIEDETLNCEGLTVLVGANGCGKSSFLHALDDFYRVDARVDENDCNDNTKPILITVTYKALTAAERGLFEKYVQDDRLVVEKEIWCGEGQRVQKYFGFELQNPEFAELRSRINWPDFRTGYAQLREKYSELPAINGRPSGETALKEWEESHPQTTERLRREDQFFGARHVGGGRLDNHTKWVLIPAVLDASQVAMEGGRDSPITQLLDFVVRSELSGSDEMNELKVDTTRKYTEIVEQATQSRLKDLERGLCSTLSMYAPGAAVEMEWKPGAVDIPPPRAETRIREDEYAATIERCGHGTQRALILTLLQHLAVVAGRNALSANVPADDGNGGETPEPHLILGIEEPELYQHPDRQRLIAKVLIKLTEGAIEGVAEHTQVIYTTHSPLFVGMDRADQIRVLRKDVPSQCGIKCTRIAELDLGVLVHELERAHEAEPLTFSVPGLRARLAAVLTPWVSEGFFARVAVLVEGETDRAAIIGAASNADHDLEEKGICVLPCGGKFNLDRPALIFRALGIQTYLLWDGDQAETDEKERQKSAKANRALLNLLGEEPQDWPWGVNNSWACFPDKIESTLREEIGAEVFEELRSRQREELGYRRGQEMKSPVAMSRILEEAAARGHSSTTLDSIVDRIVALA